MLGQPGRSGAGVLVLGVLSTAVLVSAVGVAAFRTDPAGVETVLQRGADSTLVLGDGSRRPAVEGEPVPSGTTVLAGRAGAVLATAAREVHLYPSAGVTVVDGLRQALRTGSVIVDSSVAPGLELDTPGAAVTTREGSLVRVDGGPLTRVGVLRTERAAEPGASVRAIGRAAPTEVARYYQVQVATGGLPGATSPLLLSGDDVELSLARDLVLSDRMLNQIRRTLVTDTVEGGVVLAALSNSVPDVALVAAAAPDTERALGYLIAAATSGGSEADRFLRVRGLRAAGGSWGVVAAIVGSTVDGVGVQLARLLAPSATLLAVEQQPVDLSEGLGLFNPPPSASPPVPARIRSGEPTGSGGVPAPRAPLPVPPPPARPEQQPLLPLPGPVTTPLEPVTTVLEGVVDTLVDLVEMGGLVDLGGSVPAPAPAGTPAPVRTPAPLLRLPLLR